MSAQYRVGRRACLVTERASGGSPQDQVVACEARWSEQIDVALFASITGCAPFDACGYQKQDHGQQVRDDDTRDLRVIAADTPRDHQERHRAQEPRDQCDRPEFGAEGRRDQQRPQQAEQHCSMLQQDPDVGIVAGLRPAGRVTARDG